MKHINQFKKHSIILLLITFFTLVNISCGTDKNSDNNESEKGETKVQAANPNGVGPIQEISLSDTIDKEMTAMGEEIFTAKCSACHKVEKRYIGPSPKGILDRRTPEWVMNMILNPDVMVKEDPVAKQLLIEYNGTPMANQNLTQDEARAVLEYFRTL
jgi:mono/diheme cytochrome c family protein